MIMQECFFEWCDNTTSNNLAYCNNCLQEHFDENNLPKVINSFFGEIWLACEAVVLENQGCQSQIKFRHDYSVLQEIPTVKVIGILQRRRIAGDYIPNKKIIRLMPNTSLLEYMSTLIHELSHHFAGNYHDENFLEFGRKVLNKLGFKYEYYRSPYTNRIMKRCGWKIISL